MVYGGYFCKIVVLSDILSPRTSLITDIAMNEISLLQVSHNTQRTISDNVQFSRMV
jgi:hypothetical protein